MVEELSRETLSNNLDDDTETHLTDVVTLKQTLNSPYFTFQDEECLRQLGVSVVVLHPVHFDHDSTLLLAKYFDPKSLTIVSLVEN